MKNTKELARRSKSGRTPLYYSIREDAVYATAGDGRYYLTDLTRENTEQEIINTVRKYMSM